MITRAQLVAAMPKAGPYVDAYVAPLPAAMLEFEITTPARVAAFLAQVAVESGQLSATSENLNYSADGLANTWPARYALRDAAGAYCLKYGRKLPNSLAMSLHRQPERIANNVYANRMGNGDEASGDGWRHRGAGLLELTGKTAQGAAAAYFKIDPATIGDWLRTPAGASRSAAWYWHTCSANTYADAGDFDGVCDLVNIGRKTRLEGDAIGYAERAQFFTAFKTVVA